MNDKLLQKVERTALILAGLGVVGWWYWGSAMDSVAAGAGGLLGLGNFRALRHLMGNVFLAKEGGDSRPWALLLGLKFGAFALILFLLIAVLHLNAIALVTGLTAVVAAGLFISLQSAAAAPAPKEQPAAPANERVG
jgi:hypothetical protein